MADELMRQAGAKMANTMFNLAQRAGEVIDSDLAASFDQMRKEWDTAVRAVPSSPAADAELTQLRAQNMLLLHLYDAAAKLVKAKGRFHTEQNYSALVAAYDLVRTADTPAAIKENR